MPYLETPDELADDLANKLGVYGAHDDNSCTDDRPCRPCFVTSMAERIRQAVANESTVAVGEVVPLKKKPESGPYCHWCDHHHTGERMESIAGHQRYCPGPLLEPPPEWKVLGNNP